MMDNKEAEDPKVGDGCRTRRLSAGTTRCSTEQQQSATTDLSGKKEQFVPLKPRPYRPGITWDIGSRVEAMDQLNKWYAAKIIEIDDSDQTVLIHFDGWNHRYDEWLKMNSDRLRPTSKQSDRTKRDLLRKKLAFKAGDFVLARWSDSRMYPAKIQRLTPTGSYDVVFFDGLKKTLKPTRVQAIPHDVQKKYADAGLLADIGQFARHTRSSISQQVSSGNAGDAGLQSPVSSGGPGELPRRRHSSSAAHSPGGVVSAALRRKAASLDYTQEPASKLLDDASQPYIPDPINVGTDPSTSAMSPATRSGKTRSTDASAVPVKRRRGWFRARRVSCEQQSSAAQVVAVASSLPVETSVHDESSTVSKTDDAEKQFTEISAVKTDVVEVANSAITTPMETDTAVPINVTETNETPKIDETVPVTATSKPDEAIPVSVVIPKVRGRRRSSQLGSKPLPAVAPLNTGLLSVSSGNDEQQQYQCSTCRKSFRKQSLLDYHIKYHHVTPNSVPRGGVRQRSSMKQLSALKAKPTTPAIRTRSRLTSTPLGQSTIMRTRRRFSSLPEPEPCSMTADELGVKGELNVRRVSTDTLTVFSETERNQSLDGSAQETSLVLDETPSMTHEELLVNCVCRELTSLKELIQCTCCLGHQHVHCLDLSEIRYPERYICSICRNPRGIRESARYCYDYDWLYNGRMAQFSCVSSDQNGAAKAKIMKATHDLVVDTLNVARVLDSVGREIHVLRHRIDPEFSLWKRNLDSAIDDIAVNEQKPLNEDCNAVSSCDNVSNTAYDDKIAEELCKTSCPVAETAATDVAESQLSENETETVHSESDNVTLKSPASGPSGPCVKSEDVSDVEKATENVSKGSESDQPLAAPTDSAIAPETFATDEAVSNDPASAVSVSCPTAVNVSGEHTEADTSETVMSQDDTASAPSVADHQEVDDGKEEVWALNENNLLAHITRMQDTVEDRLYLIEKQVAALENGEGNGSSSVGDPLRDLSRVKKTVHQLISDLEKVTRISLYP